MRISYAGLELITELKNKVEGERLFDHVNSIFRDYPSQASER